ncbi:MAG: hypothetical protein M1831_001470 [Alyxoria varia]|nr:MAG: hypothetical protein M1831_001470 [Alyxoria varia]
MAPTPELRSDRESAKPNDLSQRLAHIRESPKLQNQRDTGVVLSAVEDTLRDQKSEFTPTAYFAALLSLLNQHVSSSTGIVNKDVATAVVYLLDLVAPHVPTPLLRAKFAPILSSLTPSLSFRDADAPFLRSSIGCLVSLLVVQDAQAWALPQAQAGPRKAMAGLLNLAVDHRPKVRRRAQEGIVTILQNGPPTPALDHPAAGMCAETALRSFEGLVNRTSDHDRSRQLNAPHQNHDPNLIHAMQLVKTTAAATNGWPSRSLDSLCEVLFAVAKFRSEYLTLTSFDVFEAVFKGVAKDPTFSKLASLLQAMAAFEPSQNDSQLLPAWIAILSRGYDVSAQLDPSDTFSKLPDVFRKVSTFLKSQSHNIRVSASECLISFLASCIPPSVIIHASVYEEKILEHIATLGVDLLDVKYQSSWMEVFNVIAAMFDYFHWRSDPFLRKAAALVGDMRTSDTFQSKDKADAVLSKAISSMGPEAFLDVLPLNLGGKGKGKQGRAWLMPLLRDNVRNTKVAHFKNNMVPLMESFQMVVERNGEDDLVAQGRVSNDHASKSLAHLAQLAPNILAVLFNVYGETPTQKRGPILSCINSYLSITTPEEMTATFERVSAMLETGINETLSEDGVKQNANDKSVPPMRHTLMDIVVTMAIYLPRECFQNLFNLANVILSKSKEPQLQKRAYKLIPRLAQSEIGQAALRERNLQIRDTVLQSARNVQSPARKERLSAISTVCDNLPPQELEFIPLILPEVILRTKETSERAREAAFTLIIQLGEKMKAGGTINNEKISGDASAPTVRASLDEYFTILSTGLAGTTPHMISASVTAISRALFSFWSFLSEAAINNLIETMDMFLQSPTREVVRAVLGFIKVCVITLPKIFMLPRLDTLVPNLMKWSREHKARFRTKVKSILDRMIRHYGFDVVAEHCPTEDHKFIVNIRKTRDRQKRKKTEDTKDARDEDEKTAEALTDGFNKYENEFDEAIYGSDDDESDSEDPDKKSGGVSVRKKPTASAEKPSRKEDEAYIHEDSDEPLDLLDHKALAHISSTRPLQKRQEVPGEKRRFGKSKKDPEGKLVINEDSDEEMMEFDDGGNTKGDGMSNLETDLNAYVDAIRGEDVPQRGRGGKLKFDTRRKRRNSNDGDEEEEAQPVDRGTGKVQKKMPRRGGIAQRGRGKPQKPQRRPLGMNRTQGGRVGKTGPGKRR